MIDKNSENEMNVSKSFLIEVVIYSKASISYYCFSFIYLFKRRN
jgi:hypothetical protein